jgi:hypothetical protein
LSEKEVRDLPAINTEKPMSENIEKKLSQQFGWTAYWTVLKTRMNHLSKLISKPINEHEQKQTKKYSLFSTKELIGYQVDALDGTLGDVKDFLLDDENWKIRFLIADTRIIVPDKDIFLVPERIDSIDWDQSKVKLDVTRDTIKNDPEYNSKYN